MIYYLLIPNQGGVRELFPIEVSEWWWKWCKFRFWRYREHPEHKGYLVQINKWTRMRHFEWEYWRLPRMDEIGEQLSKIVMR